MKKTALLLDPAQKTANEEPYRIRIRLQEGRTATFHYSDLRMAQEHWDQIRAHGVIGDRAIRNSEFYNGTTTKTQ